MFWVISVYFNIRNTLPKSGTFLLGHPVYVCVMYVMSVTGPRGGAVGRSLVAQLEGRGWRSWKVAGSIPGSVIGIIH